MQPVLPMQQIICGHHGKERSDVGTEEKDANPPGNTHRAASATRRRSTRPVPSQETPREETATEVDGARLLPEFDVVYAWTPRDTVIIQQMVTYLARKRQNVFVEVEELETYIYITFQQMLRVLSAS